MKEKIKISQIIVVEGQFDKVKLEQFIEAVIVPTHGFSIFTDHERKEFLKRMATERGIILLTDSDAAGFKIRAYLKGMIPNEQITDVYIPDLFGKEKRKRAPSKEGKLGVEGVSQEIIEQSLQQAGVISSEKEEHKAPITKLDLYLDGLYGREDSSERRKQLYQSLGLPEHLSVNAALPILSTLFTTQEYQAYVKQLRAQKD